MDHHFETEKAASELLMASNNITLPEQLRQSQKFSNKLKNLHINEHENFQEFDLPLKRPKS